MILKKIQELFAIAKKEYSSHPFFSVLMPVIAKTEIRRNDTIKTARIFLDGEEPLIEFSPTFCDKFVKSPEDILFILAHEICHFVLGHLNSSTSRLVFQYGDKTANLAFDIIIDHLLYKHFEIKSEFLSIINFYLDTECPQRLLLPFPYADEEDFKGEKCRELFCHIASGAPLTPYRIIQHILSHKKFKYLLMVEKIEDDHYALRTKLFGFKSRLGPLEETLLKSIGEHFPARTKAVGNTSFKTRFIETIKEIAEEGLGNIEEFSRGSGVIPLYGRRDFLELPLNNPQVFYHANPYLEKDKGIKIYFDVSGSMDDEIPLVLSLLDSVKEYISYPLYAFSLKVCPVTKDQLLKRQMVTLGGTDFDCVAEHAIKQRHEKILLITDGEADITDSNAKTLKTNHFVATILSQRGEEETVKRFSKILVKM